MITLSGAADKLRQTWQALRWNFLLALVITYLLMAALFESFLYPLVIGLARLRGDPRQALADLEELSALELAAEGTQVFPMDAITPTHDGTVESAES